MSKHTPPIGQSQLDALEERALLAADATVLAPLEEMIVPEAAHHSPAPAHPGHGHHDHQSGANEVRSFDGTGNNLLNPEWGSTGEAFLRLVDPDYADGLSAPAGSDRASPREISNIVVAQSELEPNDRYLSDFVWQWGQFIDHDLDLTAGSNPAVAMPIAVPTGDPFFDPAGTGTQTIGFSRSAGEPDAAGVLQQLNELSAFIDGSMVYGSSQETADSLRTFVGGKMKVTESANGDLLPSAGGFFQAGDIRVNEQLGLISMHTLFVREHNHWADQIAAENPSLSDEEIFQRARTLVIAEIQSITYNQWLPALLGADALSPYEGYDPTVNPGVSNLFATASFRFGHSMLSPTLLRLNNDGSVADEGNIALRDSFFNPGEVADNGIDSLLKGLATQRAQEIDSQIIDDVRNFLFGPPGSGGFDLASLNIQRGRDHGLPSYNDAREQLGLGRVSSFAEISSDPEVQARLEAAYGSVDNIDVWVGGLAEDHVPGGSVGELVRTVLVDQFERTRDGDRLWYQNTLNPHQIRMVENTTLGDIIARNTEVTNLQKNVFYTPEVLFFQAEAGKPANVGLRVQRDQVQLIDGHSGRVLESRPADSVAKVVLAGSARNGDQFAVDLRKLAGTGFRGEVEVVGSYGRGDALRVQVAHAANIVRSGEGVINVDGLNLRTAGLESVKIDVEAPPKKLPQRATPPKPGPSRHAAPTPGPQLASRSGARQGPTAAGPSDGEPLWVVDMVLEDLGRGPLSGPVTPSLAPKPGPRR